MKVRKRIGIAVTNPEAAYQSRVLEGIITQCERYDYDILSFSPLVQIWFNKKDYLSAELNIFELINFDLIDALIVVTISMTRNDDYSEVRRFERFLKQYATKPVVSVDFPLEGAETVWTDDTPAFRRLTAHVLDVHGVSPEDICLLTGRKELEISQKRIRGFREELEAHGYEFDESRVFYGDYWYPGGTELAERIISGEVKLPKAVICGNDQMAIGLANRLSAAGISVPEQVIVTGFDATQDAVINDIPITSFLPGVSIAGQKAVNAVRRMIDPDAPEIPADVQDDSSLCIGSSCGCQTNIDYLRSNFKLALYRTTRDYSRGFESDRTDMATVIESYMLEQIAGSQSPNDCLMQIYLAAYLLKPFRNFYLCLRPDWLNTYRTLHHGYPDTMKTVIHTVPQGVQSKEDSLVFCSDTDSTVFSTSKLLPVLGVPRDKPGVFYFVPVHFEGDTLGYCVLHCDLSDRVWPTAVFRNWIRNVNSGLEMLRVQNKLLSYSLYDSMTGLYNRRGMDKAYRELCRRSSEGDSCMVCVIDINWLKKINDNYGHFEGDQAIMLVAHCVSELAIDERWFAVRAGGDEFFVIGIGQFDDRLPEIKHSRLLSLTKGMDRESGKPYRLSVSMGSCLRPFTPDIRLEELVHEADAQMYENKKLIKQTENFLK